MMTKATFWIWATVLLFVSLAVPVSIGAGLLQTELQFPRPMDRCRIVSKAVIPKIVCSDPCARNECCHTYYVPTCNIVLEQDNTISGAKLGSDWINVSDAQAQLSYLCPGNQLPCYHYLPNCESFCFTEQLSDASVTIIILFSLLTSLLFVASACVLRRKYLMEFYPFVESGNKQTFDIEMAENINAKTTAVASDM